MSVVIAKLQLDTIRSTPVPMAVGEVVRRAYMGAWRTDAPPLDLSLEEVSAILPQLIDFGGVGLVWPRLRHRAAEYGAAGMALEHAYRQQQERNVGAPARIGEAVGAIRAAGIEPVLFKGWTVSRAYPPGVVRLAGDIDVVTRPDEVERARVATSEPHLTNVKRDVDLHDDRDWKDAPRSDFRDFTVSIDVEGISVCVLRPELHLHVLCHHFMRHACLRPLWLCDIALLIESRHSDFDWEFFLGNDSRRRGWVITAIGLAHGLLGARIGDAPIAAEATSIPSWLGPAVIRRWEYGEIRSQSVLSEIGTRGPLTMLSRHRWPDPVGATIYLGAPFNRFPRLPLQWSAFLHRAATYGVPHMTNDVWHRVRSPAPASSSR